MFATDDSENGVWRSCPVLAGIRYSLRLRRNSRGGDGGGIVEDVTILVRSDKAGQDQE